MLRPFLLDFFNLLPLMIGWVGIEVLEVLKLKLFVFEWK
jgi:hypothetical protein